MIAETSLDMTILAKVILPYMSKRTRHLNYDGLITEELHTRFRKH